MTVPREDLTGCRFGMLTVIRQTDDYIYGDSKHKTMWECECDCGKHVNVIGDNLKKGNSTSCGCKRAESLIKHGCRYTRLYSIWSNIKTRCYDVNNTNYQRYGQRGIAMCDEWRDSFDAFKGWAVSHGYADNLTIDRIDNHGGYCPENCRWTDSKTQANNRRSSRYVTVDGISKSLAAWADDLGYSRSIFHARAKLYGTTVEEQVNILAKQKSS